MTPFPEPGPGTSWFVVLPDSPDSSPWCEQLRRHAPREVAHPSGRPWLLGRWSDREFRAVRTRDRVVAVLGHHGIGRRALETAAERARHTTELDHLPRTAPGAFHLLASFGGHVRAQGPLLETHRIVHAEVGDGTTVAASRADVLAWLLDRPVDPVRLALRLLGEAAPHPLGVLPVFRDVERVPTGRFLQVAPDGRATTRSWWTPPEPHLSLSDGAARLHEALDEAVRARLPERGPVSCELGGVDSTAVCALLAKRGPVRAHTAASPDPYDDDLACARSAVAELGIDHEVVRCDRMPEVYEDFTTTPVHADEPAVISVESARFDALYRIASESGARDHFGGYGGDELLHGTPAWFRAYLRTDPALAIRNIRGSRANGRWPWAATLRQLLPTPYGAWMRRFARGLGGPPPPEGEPALDWSGTAAFAPWITTEAVREAQRYVHRASRRTAPLAPVRGMHRDLAMMTACSGMLRHLAPLAARHGLALHAPFYDTRVVDAGLSVRPQERVSRWRYKPLLTEAMRGTVPDGVVERATKAEGSAVEYYGIVHNRRALLDLFAESHLAELGLVEPQVLRECVARSAATSTAFVNHLFPSVAAETWLRRQEDPAAAARPPRRESRGPRRDVSWN